MVAQLCPKIRLRPPLKISPSVTPELFSVAEVQKCDSPKKRGRSARRGFRITFCFWVTQIQAAIDAAFALFRREDQGLRMKDAGDDLLFPVLRPGNHGADRDHQDINQPMLGLAATAKILQGLEFFHQLPFRHAGLPTPWRLSESHPIRCRQLPSKISSGTRRDRTRAGSSSSADAGMAADPLPRYNGRVATLIRSAEWNPAVFGGSPWNRLQLRVPRAGVGSLP
jgi:hypothetical protein